MSYQLLTLCNKTRVKTFNIETDLEYSALDLEEEVDDNVNNNDDDDDDITVHSQAVIFFVSYFVKYSSYKKMFQIFFCVLMSSTYYVMRKFLYNKPVSS